ncbi:hypothetical protein [Neisseria perflava]|uniref:hypothetical protein n=1 Tax=Neisseria perflava TaxID=33053 RepID=UPI0020A0BF6E|nr:hypothetical protein [Neisseria perflava]MCP1659304.1 hypothetical protein [Neisseria perflava]MCP1772893.1 hypothetical protein [Neisseria perflava]
MKGMIRVFGMGFLTALLIGGGIARCAWEPAQAAAKKLETREAQIERMYEGMSDEERMEGVVYEPDGQ